MYFLFSISCHVFSIHCTCMFHSYNDHGSVLFYLLHNIILLLCLFPDLHILWHMCIYCSGPKDHVFVNFVDHGGPGIIAFGSKMVIFPSFVSNTWLITCLLNHMEKMSWLLFTILPLHWCKLHSGRVWC